MTTAKQRRYIFLAILICGVLALSLVTVYHQSMRLGRDYLLTTQVERHRAVMENEAESPWQYRVLTEYAVHSAIGLFRQIDAPTPELWAFLAVRLLQNILIFWLGYLYYRRLGLNLAAALIGIALLGWAMTHSLYDSDLQFNTYSDLIFFLLAGLALFSRKDCLFIPLTLAAALNRETSALIPLMLLAARLEAAGTKKIALPSRETLLAAGGSAAAYLLCYAGLRWFYGAKEIIIPYGIHPGLQMAWYNLSSPLTWINLVSTVSLLPVIALLSVKKWPVILKRIALAVVPAWLLVHLFMAIIAETRLLLVPLALVFIPGAVFGCLPGSRGAGGKAAGA